MDEVVVCEGVHDTLRRCAFGARAFEVDLGRLFSVLVDQLRCLIESRVEGTVRLRISLPESLAGHRYDCGGGTSVNLEGIGYGMDLGILQLHCREWLIGDRKSTRLNSSH